jgi:hypothetical protein
MRPAGRTPSIAAVLMTSPWRTHWSSYYLPITLGTQQPPLDCQSRLVGECTEAGEHEPALPGQPDCHSAGMPEAAG